MPTSFRRFNVKLIVGSIGRHAEDNRLYTFFAEEAVSSIRLDVDDRARLDLDHVVVQFHLAPALQNVVTLSALLVIVPGGVLDEGHVEVADGGLWVGERPRALAAFAPDSGSILKSTDEITLAGNGTHGRTTPSSYCCYYRTYPSRSA